MKKVIVTGGSGFLGKAVVRKLLEQNVEIAVLARNLSSSTEQLGVRQICGDIRDLDFLKSSFLGYDTVIHLAAKTGIWGAKEDYFSVNLQGTHKVIEACLAAGVSALVYASTPSVVYHNGDLCGVNERTPYTHSFLSPFTQSKMLAEKAVLDSNSDYLKATVLRPHLIWGPGDTNLIPRLLGKARCRQLRRVGDGHNLVDITFLDNAAEAFVLAARELHGEAQSAGKAYFISQGEPVNLWNWLNRFFRRLDIPVIESSVSFRQAYYVGMFFEFFYTLFHIKNEPCMTRFLAVELAKSHWFSIENAHRDFGYAPHVSTTEGINRVIDWIKQSAI